MVVSEYSYECSGPPNATVAERIYSSRARVTVAELPHIIRSEDGSSPGTRTVAEDPYSTIHIIGIVMILVYPQQQSFKQETGPSSQAPNQGGGALRV